MVKTKQDEVLQIFEKYDAAWVHDGDPVKPHADRRFGR